MVVIGVRRVTNINKYKAELEKIAQRINFNVNVKNVKTKKEYQTIVDNYLNKTKAGRVLITSGLNRHLFNTKSTQKALKGIREKTVSKQEKIRYSKIIKKQILRDGVIRETYITKNKTYFRFRKNGKWIKFKEEK